jgi:ATP-dependent Clp protease ATP-binding subunit ClpA
MKDSLKQLTDWALLEKLLDKAETSDSRDIDEADFIDFCRSKVKGQDPVIKDVCRLITLEWFKGKRQRPVANLLFLGSTGTGKTELAKAVASYLFEDEKSLLRFDCSEFTGPHSKDRLIGSPPGYVGSEQGGQLTRAIMTQPKRVILFDEIEKAHSSVFDLFLQMMGEGRLTDQGSGTTADFTQSVIILTSNALADKMADLNKQFSDNYELANALKGTLADSQVFRPEILGRIDRISIFSPLQGAVMAEIALLKIYKLASDYGITLNHVAAEAIMDVLIKNKKISRFGVRELERIIFDLFASPLAEVKRTGCRKARIGITKDGKFKVEKLAA